MKIATLEYIHRLLKEDYENKSEDVETIEHQIEFTEIYSDRYYELKSEHTKAVSKKITSRDALLDFEGHEF